MCPNAAIAECVKACLYTAGRGRFSSVELSRIRKTLYWIDHQERFLLNHEKYNLYSCLFKIYIFGIFITEEKVIRNSLKIVF